MSSYQVPGIDALIDDSLVGLTMTMGAYLVGLLSSLPAYNSDRQYMAPMLLFAFRIDIQCSLMLGSSIEAGVPTIFVGWGEDPQVLANCAPQLFSKIASMYPQVVTGV
ncbi:hypothetical protein FISHEDRAFT_73145 [Fistulina hepatica ATCC 64428]|uniref:Protein PNS1 n=1 Tax=Fistulina hepatica ATCC 64428 TaxID=1128425 RepID=A0A0D7ADZ4_9AGAR|nr:hypothetical protein FISHEDRAFT_73145 [Fistulina hepatica ATCC 64428]